MTENIVLELKNRNKYIVIDMIDLENKKYFLLSKLTLDETDIDNQFDIYTLNEECNFFDSIEDEIEYNYIKELFEQRLNEKRQELNNREDAIPKLIKLKLKNIDNHNYLFETTTGEQLTLDIEIYGNKTIQINDYIYITESIVQENITLRFGPIYTDKTEIIKIIHNNEIYYLQRYYG